MNQIISHGLRRLSEHFFFASSLNQDTLNHLIHELNKMIEDDRNFDLSKPSLTFSKIGLNTLKRIDPTLVAGTLMEVIRKIDNAISTAGALSSHPLKLLNDYLKTLRKRPGRWINVKLDNQDKDKAVDIVKHDVLNPLMHAMSSLHTHRKVEEDFTPTSLSPEQYKELQEPYETYEDLKR